MKKKPFGDINILIDPLPPGVDFASLTERRVRYFTLDGVEVVEETRLTMLPRCGSLRILAILRDRPSLWLWLAYATQVLVELDAGDVKWLECHALDWETRTILRTTMPFRGDLSAPSAHDRFVARFRNTHPDYTLVGYFNKGRRL